MNPGIHVIHKLKILGKYKKCMKIRGTNREARDISPAFFPCSKKEYEITNGAKNIIFCLVRIVRAERKAPIAICQYSLSFPIRKKSAHDKRQATIPCEIVCTYIMSNAGLMANGVIVRRAHHLFVNLFVSKKIAVNVNMVKKIAKYLPVLSPGPKTNCTKQIGRAHV